MTVFMVVLLILYLLILKQILIALVFPILAVKTLRLDTYQKIITGSLLVISIGCVKSFV